MSDTPSTSNSGGFQKVWTAVKPHLPTVATVVVCVLLIPMILYNVVMSLQSLINPDKYPTMFGFAPLLVNNDVAEPDIKSGDMIFAKVVDPEEIVDGDVIMFFDTNLNNKGKVQIHEVTQVVNNGGDLYFLTKVINPTEQTGSSVYTVPASNLIARYEGARIPVLGAVLGFMGSIPGVLVCVGVPLLAVIGYMVYKSIRKSRETNDLKAELERLRREKESQDQDQTP